VIHLRLLQICRYCISDGVPKRSFFLALIVGTVLNLINQGEILFGESRLNASASDSATLIVLEEMWIPPSADYQ
jgi:hypothetical protein